MIGDTVLAPHLKVGLLVNSNLCPRTPHGWHLSEANQGHILAWLLPLHLLLRAAESKNPSPEGTPHNKPLSLGSLPQALF